MLTSGSADPAQVVGPYLRFLLPGERTIACWAAGRVYRVQRKGWAAGGVRHASGQSDQLVAGAYSVVAALWASLGAAVALAGIVEDVSVQHSTAAAILLLVGAVMLVTSFVRQAQSKNARRRNYP